MNFNKPLFYLLLLGMIFSCRGDDDTNDKGIDSRYYFTAEINGTQIQVQYGDNDFFSGSQSATNQDDLCVRGYGSSITIFENNTSPSLRVNFESLLSFSQACTNELIEDNFPTAFKAEEYPYETELWTEKNITLQYIDENDIFWTSNDGDQSSASLFEVIESALVTSTKYSNNQIIEVKCRFNCTLFNDNNESLELINGEAFYLYFNG